MDITDEATEIAYSEKPARLYGEVLENVNHGSPLFL